MHTQIPEIEEIVGHEHVVEPFRSELELRVIDKMRDESD
jgi:hypothetical protein